MRKRPYGRPRSPIPHRRVLSLRTEIFHGFRRDGEAARAVGIRVLVAVLAFVALTVMAFVSALMKGDEKAPRTAGPPHTISLPSSVDAYKGHYRRATGNVVDRFVARMRKSSKTDGGKLSSQEATVYDKAAIAVYEKNRDFDQRFIFLGMTAAIDPSLAEELGSNSPANEADEIFRGEGDFPNTSDFPPGAFGGVLRCGIGKVGSTPSAMCAWVDGSTLGVFLAPKLSAADLASIALTFRDGAEH
ncbi:MAG: hypothetical protein ACRDP6_00035 [Actinoallomurus sp.]